MNNTSISHLFYLLLLVTVVNTSGCVSIRSTESVRITLLHMNDVYEITPIGNGKYGGLARVATLRKQLLMDNPNTIAIMGGDFFSPSAIGTAKIDDKHVAGKQMVDVLNSLGLDYATFGNHEFDLKRKQFYQRISEVKFEFISANVRDEHGSHFPNVSDRKVITFKNQAGNVFKLGVFGVTLNSNQVDYVTYRDVLTSAKEQIYQLEQEVDFILVLSHQAIRDDERMIRFFPEIDLLLGGHEHENYQSWRGVNNTPILKADANARSVYVVDILFNPVTGDTSISPRIVFIDNTIKEDPDVKSVVENWMKKVFDSFRQKGFEPEEVLATVNEPLDGLDASVRKRSTNLSQLIAESLLLPYPKAELSIYNSGSIRVDDYLPTGNITVYDIIRTLPFGDSVALVEIQGELLKKILDQGVSNSGSGGYLQWANVEYTGKEWLIQGEILSEARNYKVAIVDFLLSGRETGLGYLNRKNPRVTVLDEGKQWDIRNLVGEKLKTLNKK